MTVPNSGDVSPLDQQRKHWNDATERWCQAAPFWDRAIEPVITAMVNKLDLGPGMRALDIACGLGPTSRALAAAVGESGHVLAVDLSEEMIAAVKRRSEPMAQLHYQVLDAGGVSDDQPAFDGALCCFGLMHFLEQRQALQSVKALLTPGQPLVASVWGMTEEVPALDLPRRIARKALGLPEEIADANNLGDPADLRQALEAGGLREVAVEAVDVRFRFDDIEQYLDFCFDMSSHLRGQLLNRSERDVRLVRTAISGAVEPYRSEGNRVSLPARAYVGSGVA